MSAPYRSLRPRKSWGAAPGKLTTDHAGFQDKTCFVCGKLIPAGTPHQIRHMCVYAACASCDYPREKGNYQ